MKKNYCIKFIAVVLVMVTIAILVIDINCRNSLMVFEKNFKNKNLQFFEKKIRELKYAEKNEILDFDLKMSIATNTLLIDYDLVKKIKKKRN
ncbi:MAG: hypothetical protein V4548_12985 [Bacteroidota bacterium]